MARAFPELLCLAVLLLAHSRSDDAADPSAGETCDGSIVQELQQQVASLRNELTLCRSPTSATTGVGKRRSVDLVVAIISAPGNVGRRSVLRQTWLPHASKLDHAAFHFYVGILGNEQVQRQLLAESEAHEDMVLMQFEEEYSKLSQKIKQVLIRVHDDFDFKYCLKLDDDSYVKPAALYKLVTSQPSERLYFGLRTLRGRPHRGRGHKWHLSTEVWFPEELPPYVEGFAYVLSADMVAWISGNRDMLKPLSGLDDISVALWLLALQVHPRHTKKFGHFPSMATPDAKCDEDAIILGHVEASELMLDLHAKVSAGSNFCPERPASNLLLTGSIDLGGKSHAVPVYEGQTAAQVAKTFARKHKLDDGQKKQVAKLVSQWIEQETEKRRLNQ